MNHLGECAEVVAAAEGNGGGAPPLNTNCLIVEDTGKIVLGENGGGVDNVTYPSIQMLFEAGGPIPFGAVVKLIDDGGGKPIVIEMPELDATSIPIIGFAAESAMTGQDIHINILGAFTCRLETTSTSSTSIGSILTKSLATLNDGNVHIITTVSRGMIGIAMQIAAPGELLVAIPVVVDVV
jgi:hypothetical protein